MKLDKNTKIMVVVANVLSTASVLAGLYLQSTTGKEVYLWTMIFAIGMIAVLFSHSYATKSVVDYGNKYWASVSFGWFVGIVFILTGFSSFVALFNLDKSLTQLVVAGIVIATISYLLREPTKKWAEKFRQEK